MTWLTLVALLLVPGAFFLGLFRGFHWGAEGREWQDWITAPRDRWIVILPPLGKPTVARWDPGRGMWRSVSHIFWTGETQMRAWYPLPKVKGENWENG